MKILLLNTFNNIFLGCKTSQTRTEWREALLINASNEITATLVSQTADMPDMTNPLSTLE